MVSFVRRLSCLFCLAVASTAALASEDEIWSANTSSGWIKDHIAAERRMSRLRSTYRLKRTQVWANGLDRSGMQAFDPNAFDPTVGAKLQPLRNYDFYIGTELIRNQAETGGLSSKATWEAFLTRDWKGLSGITLGIAASGSVDTVQKGYTQSVAGTVDIPLNVPLRSWDTALRLSPNANLDALNGDFSTSLMAEVMGQTQLTSPADRFKSVLNIRLGYGVAPGTRPAASATLELRITPN
jgi:hypothetical protein